MLTYISLSFLSFLFSFKNFVPVTVKIRVTVSSRVRVRFRVRVRVRIRVQGSSSKPVTSIIFDRWHPYSIGGTI